MITVTLKLSADETHVLQEIAQAAGVSVEVVLHGLIAQLTAPPEAEIPPSSVPPADPEVFDPEAVDEQQREQEEMEANIKRWHQERERTEQF